MPEGNCLRSVSVEVRNSFRNDSGHCQDFMEDRRTLEEFLIAVGHCIRFE